MRALSLCSGIGGLDLAAEWAGVEVVGQVEIDPYCRAVLAKHWPDVPRFEDLREVTGDECGAVDLVFGGVPCQPFSKAGRRRGLSDERNLWPEAFRIIQRAWPTWVCIENVSHFASLALDDVCLDLASEGYQTRAYLLPACATGAPHERERIFIVAYCHTLRSPVAYAGRTRLERFRAALATRQLGKAESRVGRDVDGLPGGLDGHRWPAGPSEAQYGWEPLRTVTGKIPNRAARLKALGNAVVPQQAYPIFAAIVEAERTTL